MGISTSRLFIIKAHSRFLRFIFQTLYQLKCAFVKNEIISFKLADGSNFDYPLRSSIGQALFCRYFEPYEVAYLRSTLKTGSIFLDIGANGGIYTIIAANQVGPDGHVYAFEPIERELKLLKNNIKINNLKNVTVIECAVSDKSGVARFAVAEDGALNSLANLNRPNQKIKYWQTINTISLDDFVKKYSINKVDFIKIDVEGAEKLVFEGAKNLMASDNRITIMFEASDSNEVSFGYCRKQLLTEMSQAGLDIYYHDIQHRLIIINDFNNKLSDKIYNFVTFNH